MNDLRHKLEKLISDAAECEMIASLASEKDKREAFRALAQQYRKMAAAIQQVINQRQPVPWMQAAAQPSDAGRPGITGNGEGTADRRTS
jgi:hypothetical protein